MSKTNSKTTKRERQSRERGGSSRASACSAIADLESRRRDFEHATWKRANGQKYGGNWPVLYNAGELGYCLLEWTGAFGGHWKNRWFDKVETLSPNIQGEARPHEQSKEYDNE